MVSGPRPGPGGAPVPPFLFVILVGARGFEPPFPTLASAQQGSIARSLGPIAGSSKQADSRCVVVQYRTRGTRRGPCVKLRGAFVRPRFVAAPLEHPLQAARD